MLVAITKKILLFFLLLVSILLFNTFTVTTFQRPLHRREDPINFAHLTDKLIKQLSRAITFQTISYDDPKLINHETILEFHEFLETSYPVFFRTLDCEVVNTYSILCVWKGTNPDKKPILMTAHMDVVPIENLKLWSVPPFEGIVKDGHVYGRGSLDDKYAVLALMESVQELINQSFTPTRSIYFAFGHDEEIGGFSGAQHIAKILEQRGITFEFLLDEGTPIINDEFVPGFKAPFALIGLSEKGSLFLELKAKGAGGHSSAPPDHTPIGVLSQAITKIENNPMKSSFLGPAKCMFEFFASEVPFLFKIVLANIRLFEKPLLYMFSFDLTTRTLFQTSQSVTIMNSGSKANVIPTVATAIVNFRIAPFNSVKEVKDHVVKTINDPNIEISEFGGEPLEPSPITSHETIWYKNLEDTIKQVFSSEHTRKDGTIEPPFSKNLLVIPGLMVANTDTRHYWNLTQNIFRFNPLFLTKLDIKRIHGADERISIENYVKVVEFFHELIRNSDEISL